MTVQRIGVKHNVEMAHRLFETSGKCEQIHGHSWNVTLTLTGPVDSDGLLCGIEFGQLKKIFRSHLDSQYDHRLLLNAEDPWSGLLIHSFEHDLVSADPKTGTLGELPGLKTIPCDPTTENFARLIGEWFVSTHVYDPIVGVNVGVWETPVNYSEWHWEQA